MKSILFAVKLMIKTGEDHVSAYATSAAFFIMLSAIPFFLLLLTSIQYTPAINKGGLLDVVNSIAPSNLKPILITIINEVYQKSTAIIPLTAITALWSASRAILAITRGLNAVCEVEESRNYLVLRVRSAFYTVLMIFVIVLTLTLLVFGNKLHAFLSEYVTIFSNISGFLISFRTIGSLGILVVFFSFLYKYLPNRSAPLLIQVPGALFTAVGWSVFSFGFSIYLDQFDGMKNMYGSLTTIVLVMLWLYFCMYIMLLGAEINVLTGDKILEISYRRKQDREEKKRRNS